METIRVAEIRKTFGLKGEVLCYSLTSFPALRFKKGRTFYLTKEGSEEKHAVTLASFRDSDEYCYLRFQEIPSIEEAEKWLHYYIEIDKSEAPIPKDYIRLNDLFACDVYDEEGNKLGHATELIENATTPSLRVQREGAKDFFVPWKKDVFIKDVDIDAKKVIIHVIPGMIE